MSDGLRLARIARAVLDEGALPKTVAWRVRRLLSRYELTHADAVTLWDALEAHRGNISRPKGRKPLRIAPQPPRAAYAIVVPWGRHKGQTLGALASDSIPGGRGWLEWLASDEARADGEWGNAARMVLQGRKPRLSANDIKPPRFWAQAVLGKHGLISDILLLRLPPSELLKDHIALLDGARWNKELGRWEVPGTRASHAIRLIGDKALVTMDPATSNYVDAEFARQEALVRCAKKGELSPVTPTVVSLYDYQDQGVEYCELCDGRCMIGDAPGMGKTPIAIGYAYKHKLKTLFIVPALVVTNWAKEIRRFTGIMATPWETDGPLPNPTARGHLMHVISYDMVPKHYDKIVAQGFDLVVLDEADKLRGGARTIIGRAIFGDPGDRATYPGLQPRQRIALTGTENRAGTMREAFALLNWLDPYRFPSWSSFKATVQSLVDLYHRKTDVVLRRMKEEYIDSLPPVQMNVVYVSMTDEERKEYRRVVEAVLGKGGGKRNPSVTEMHPLSDFLIRVKRQRIWQMTDQFVDAGRTVLTFSSRIAPLKATAARYGEIGGLLTGETSRANKQKVIHGVQSGTIKCANLSIEAGGVGITLTRATECIFHDLGWTPALIEQAFQRAWRNGQLKQVSVYLLVVHKTVEERIWAIHERKKKGSSAVQDGVEQMWDTDASVMSEVFDDLRRELAA